MPVVVPPGDCCRHLHQPVSSVPGARCTARPAALCAAGCWGAGAADVLPTKPASTWWAPRACSVCTLDMYRQSQHTHISGSCAADLQCHVQAGQGIVCVTQGCGWCLMMVVQQLLTCCVFVCAERVSFAAVLGFVYTSGAVLVRGSQVAGPHVELGVGGWGVGGFLGAGGWAWAVVVLMLGMQQRCNPLC